MVMLHIKLKNDACSNMIANSVPADPPPTLWAGSKGHNSSFTEPYHVAYQIKWNHECRNMVATILTPEGGVTRSKFNLFRP